MLNLARDIGRKTILQESWPHDISFLIGLLLNSNLQLASVASTLFNVWGFHPSHSRKEILTNSMEVL